MSKTKQSFLKGAIILVVANLLVKVISAVFKIPLTLLLKADGMGLFTNAYSIYTVMFIVATAGFPVAISKMVSESIVRGRRHEADRIFKIALCFLFGIGVLGTFVLYWFAEPLALMLNRGSARSALSIVAISPAVICIALVAAFRGYFQGQQNMYPTAISEVVEAIGKLAIGYGLAYFFIHNLAVEDHIQVASAGAIFGVTSGTFLALLSLVVIYIYTHRNKHTDRSQSRSIKSLFIELVSLAVPVTIGASVASLTNLIDAMTIQNRLQAIVNPTAEFFTRYALLSPSAGFVDGTFANKLYGLYMTYAGTMFNLPLVVIVALSMSIVPAVATLLAGRDLDGARTTVTSVLRITVIFAAPCAIGISVLSAPILTLIYAGEPEAALAAPLLTELSIAIIWVSLVSITSAILQATGKVYVPVINMLIGGIIKVTINYFLVANPNININGAPIGTNVCYVVIVLLNLYFLMRVLSLKLDLVRIFVLPIVCASLMGVGAWVAYSLLSYAGLSNLFATPLAIGVGAACYGVLACLTRTITEEDVVILPKGRRIVALLHRLRLM